MLTTSAARSSSNARGVQSDATARSPDRLAQARPKVVVGHGAALAAYVGLAARAVAQARAADERADPPGDRARDGVEPVTVQEAVIAMLRRFGETAPDDATIHSVDCGIHSGFAPCCIAFFVKVWSRWMRMTASLHAHGETLDQRLARSNPAQAEALHAMQSYLRVVNDDGVGYVPCPRCALDGDFVEPRPCSQHLSKRQRDNVRKALAQR